MKKNDYRSMNDQSNKLEKTNWWDLLSVDDKDAINEGIRQLDNKQFLTHSEVRNKIKEKFNF
jgi:hypothetical protein